MSYTRTYVENDKNLEIFTIEDFLTDEECDHLCSMIEKNHTRSTVSGTGYTQSVVSDFRTSSTSTLNYGDSVVDAVDQRIADECGVSAFASRADSECWSASHVGTAGGGAGAVDFCDAELVQQFGAGCVVHGAWFVKFSGYWIPVAGGPCDV